MVFVFPIVIDDAVQLPKQLLIYLTHFLYIKKKNNTIINPNNERKYNTFFRLLYVIKYSVAICTRISINNGDENHLRTFYCYTDQVVFYRVIVYELSRKFYFRFF